MAARFDQYATYLKSPEYAAEMAALLIRTLDMAGVMIRALRHEAEMAVL